VPKEHKERKVLKDFREHKVLQQETLEHRVPKVLKEQSVLKERFKGILVSKVLKVLKEILVPQQD
jgi:hypothetical protein